MYSRVGNEKIGYRIAFRHLTGDILPHDRFSGGENKGQANYVLRNLGFRVDPINHEPAVAYILTWNPEKWDEWNFDEIVRLSRIGEVYSDFWNTGKRKSMLPGERVYLMRQGDNQGLIGSGYTTSDVYTTSYSNRSGQTINAVNVDFDIILPVTDVLSVDKLREHDLGISWNAIYASGNAVPASGVQRLEDLWNTHLATLGRRTDRLPNEVIGPTRFSEGAVKKVYVNSYERSSSARAKCVEHWGLDCAVCGFNFSARYGEIGNGFIHVHHLKDLASIGEEYQIDAIQDLRPVCPNCHAMLYRRERTLSIEELRMQMESVLA